MKRLPTLFVSFENEIVKSQLAAFRGAIIEKVGRTHAAFHNHRETEGFIYQYPVIQYKMIQRKPVLFCIGQGIEEVHHFFSMRKWDILLQGERMDLKVHKLNLNTFNLNVWDKMFSYSILDWLALNVENYKKYQAIDGLAGRVGFLEKLLIGNILSFAKGVDWHIEKPVKVEIQQLKGQKMIRYKGVPLMAFDVDFKTNVFLPNYLGLGKSASHGFGVIHQNKNNSK